jgi:tripartite-type tricarboxylate transporter receptor subunit TctC
MAGVDVVHVPYKRATTALADVIAGQVAMSSATCRRRWTTSSRGA